MDIPRPEPGLIIRYNFLWSHETEAGRRNARKARPCAIITSVEIVEGRTVVTVAPLTHSRPSRPENAVEVPPPVKRTLGLDDEPSWIIADELNRSTWPGPDLEPASSNSDSISYGRLPKRLLLAVLHAVLNNVRIGRAKTVKRTE